MSLVALMALIAGACTLGEPDGASLGQADQAEVTDGPFALGERGEITLDDPSFPDPLIELDDIGDGGPPPDGIPPIDAPNFDDVSEVDWIEPHEPVILLDTGSSVRIYPIQVLIWHEIVNDTVDGTAISVTYCPLCNSAYAWERTVDDEVLSFGTSGKLWNSSLLMYDRQTRSLWGHFTGQAVAGAFSGTLLVPVPVTIASWGDASGAYPEASVLNRETGEDRLYGSNPYPGYDNVDIPPFLYDGEVDDRLAAKERILGVRSGEESVAITFDRLEQDRVIKFTLDGRSLVAVWSPGTVSALDNVDVQGGAEVGAVNVFETELTRGDNDGEFVSPDGTIYNVLGQGVVDPVSAPKLATVEHVDTFWFAWGAFQPESELIR